MNSRFYIYTIVLTLFFASCIKVDRNIPYISTLKVNGQGSDTIYVVDGTLYVNFEVSDDVLLIDTKLKLVELANLDSGFYYLNIQNIDAKNYTGEEIIMVPDSIKEHSKLFKLSVDAFDDSGNRANQLSKLINFK